MSPSPSPVEHLLRQVRHLRTRWRWLVLAEGAGLALAAALGVVLGAVALDNWLHLPWPIRLGLLILFIAGIAWMFAVRVVLPLRRPYTEEAVAVHLEGLVGEKNNRIINSVQLGRLAVGEPPAAVLKALDENTEAIRKGPSLERALPIKNAARWIGAFLVIAVAIFAYAKYFPSYFQNAIARLTKPLAHIQPLTQTTLEVKPGSMEVPLGSTAEIQMITGGKKPDKVVLQFQRGSGNWERVELSPYAPNRYSHTFLDVRQTITYTVMAGDARSERFHIRAVEGPDVAGIDVTIHYPEYTGLPDKQDKDGHGDLLAPLGSRITLSVRSTRALRGADITLPGAKPVRMKREGTDTFQWEGVLDHGGSYQLGLTDLRGYKNTLAIERDCKIQPDRLPTVELKVVSNGTQTEPTFELTPDEPQPVAISAQDDFGVREVRLLAWKSEADTPKVLLAQAGAKTQRTVEQTRALTAKELGVVGETWTVVAEATDFNPDKDRKPVRSQTVRVRLVATRDLVDSKLVAAGELKRGLTELIQLQQANIDLCKTIAPDFESDRIPKWADASFATLTMKHYENAATNQVTIRVKTADLSKKVDVSTFNGIREALDNLVQRDMVLATEQLTDGLALRDLTERRDKLQSSLQVQTVIRDTLTALLEQASNLETEIALQTVVAGLEKILKVEQDLQGKTPPNSSAPDAKGAAALADKQKETASWLVDLQKRLDDTTARTSAEKIAAAKVFMDLNAAFKAKNLPPVMQAAETSLRGLQWPPALQAETQAIDSLQSLLAMIRNELSKVADSIATSLRDALKKAPSGSTAETNIYKALKTAAQLAKEGSDKKSIGGKQTNVPERPIGEEMEARDIAKYLKRLQDAAKAAEAAKKEIKRDYDPDSQRKAAESLQTHRDKKDVDPSKYHLTSGKESPRSQDWSAFEGAKGGPKKILKEEKPDDIEDLIGDLIQDQDRLREKMITSFMEMNTDLQDTGNVGDQDTPMGNYAMRGKTGNKTAASINVGGRSRSGRQAPTFGEMGVNKSKDLAGRPGEGLNAPDQKGFVQEERVEGDPGASPSTATGGKHAGQDQREGEIGKPRASDAGQYQGIAAADIIQEGHGTADTDVSAEALKRDLASRQAQLVKRADEVTKQFEQLFTPSADWFKGVDLMRQIEEEVRKGPSERLWQLQEQALEKLKRVYREIVPGAPYDFDVGLNKSDNPLVLNPRQVDFPKRDEDALKKYYLRLAEDQ